MPASMTGSRRLQRRASRDPLSRLLSGSTTAPRLAVAVALAALVAAHVEAEPLPCVIQGDDCIFYQHWSLGRPVEAADSSWDYVFDNTDSLDGLRLVIASNATLECAVPFCSLRLAAERLDVRGSVSASILSIRGEESVSLRGCVISASGLGSAGGLGAAAGRAAPGSSGGGGGYAGAGGPACDDGVVPAIGGGTAEGPEEGALSVAGVDVDAFHLSFGSGGGSAQHDNGQSYMEGGRSGGVVVVSSGDELTMSLEATIHADGGHGEGDVNGWEAASGGGGSGGVVVVSAVHWEQVVGGGLVAARGGSSRSGSGDDSIGAGDGGAGGGGHVVLVTGDADGIPANVLAGIGGGSSTCGFGGRGSAIILERFAARRCVMDGSDAFQCECSDGFEDAGCTVCNSSTFGPTCSFPCPGDCGHGVCSNSALPGDTGCTCDTEWQGDRCDECAAGYYGSNCENSCGYCGEHADCIDGRDGTGLCLCHEGWAAETEGGLCDSMCADEFWGPECDKTCGVCGVHGECLDGMNGDGSCDCDVGWAGDECDECAPGYFGFDCGGFCGACPAHSECDDGLHGLGCVCTGTWKQEAPNAACDDCQPLHYGPTCAPCPVDCGVHGTCEDGVFGSGVCLCDAGWAGETCQDCDATHFGPSCTGVCPDCGDRLACSAGIVGTGACKCSGGFRGAQCDECGVGFQGAECTVCATGYYSRHCLPCTCSSNGVCDDGNTGDGHCTCRDGWTGPDCDECEEGRYGSSCRLCPDECPDTQDAAVVCDGGVSGSGLCVCGEDRLRGVACCEDDDAVGDDCGLADSADVCEDTETACMPGIVELTQGYDMAFGRYTGHPVTVLGFSSSEWDDIADVSEVGAVEYRVPADLHLLTAENEAAQVSEDGTVLPDREALVTTANEARQDVAGSLGLRIRGDGSALPSGALSRHPGFATQVQGIVAHRFTASAQHEHHVVRVTAPLAGRIGGYQGSQSGPTFSSGFRDAVASLPPSYSTPQEITAYQRFVSTFGTHVPVVLTLGGRVRAQVTSKLCVPIHDLVANSEAMGVLTETLHNPAQAGDLSSGRGHWMFVGRELSVTATGGDAEVYEVHGVEAWEETVPASLQVVQTEFIGLSEAVARLVTTQTAAVASNTAQAVLDYMDKHADAAAVSLLSPDADRNDFADLDVTADAGEESTCPGEPLPESFVSAAAAHRATAVAMLGVIMVMVAAETY